MKSIWQMRELRPRARKGCVCHTVNPVLLSVARCLVRRVEDLPTSALTLRKWRNLDLKGRFPWLRQGQAV